MWSDLFVLLNSIPLFPYTLLIFLKHFSFLRVVYSLWQSNYIFIIKVVRHSLVKLSSFGLCHYEPLRDLIYLSHSLFSFHHMFAPCHWYRQCFLSSPVPLLFLSLFYLQTFPSFLSSPLISLSLPVSVPHLTCSGSAPPHSGVCIPSNITHIKSIYWAHKSELEHIKMSVISSMRTFSRAAARIEGKKMSRAHAV